MSISAVFDHEFKLKAREEEGDKDDADTLTDEADAMEETREDACIGIGQGALSELDSQDSDKLTGSRGSSDLISTVF